MLLNEELESKISENKSSIIIKKKKRKKKSNHYKYPTKKVYKFYNNTNSDDKISLTEHNNILNEYEEELKFLNLKRKNSENCEKEQKKNSNTIICSNNNNNNKKEKKLCNKKEYINNNKNEKIKISQLYNLYHYLFIKSGLDCASPSRFVDYLSNELNDVNENSSKNGKINFENIKKILLNLDKEDLENSLIDKLIKEYFHCTFKNSFFEKVIKKINNKIIDQNNNDNNSINIRNNKFDKNTKSKKDKYNYSNLLVEKINNNHYKSSLSMSNDSELFKSIIYMNNKHLINNNNITENNIIKSLETFKNKLNSFKEENKENVNKNDKEYLKNLFYSKKLRKYINKKLLGFNQCFKNNNILKILDNNNFNQIIKLLIDNKKENKKMTEKINELKINQNINDNDINNFILILVFIAGITTVNSNPKQLSKSDLSILTPIFQYFDKLSNIKLIKKKKIKIKKINNKNTNKFKIKIDDNNSEENKIGNSLSCKEEIKIEGENKEEKVKEKEKIIIFMDNNDNSLYNQKISNTDNKSYKNDTSTNEMSSIKIPNSNQGSINQNSNHIISEFKNGHIEFNDFQKKLLNDLSLGKDLFRLNCVKIREKKIKNKNEIKEKLYSEINIEINEETTKINNDENYVNKNDKFINQNIILKKDGNKIIIYNDEFSEDNKNQLK